MIGRCIRGRTVGETIRGTGISQAVASLAFHALTPDPLTYEMRGVLVGTGDLATTHTSPLYALDHEGTYHKFAANEPVWAGGRVVQNKIINSQDMSQLSYGLQGGATVTGTDVLNIGGAVPSLAATYVYEVPVSIAGYTLTFSVVLSGSGTVTMVLGNGEQTELAYKTVTLTGTPTRYSLTVTFTSGTYPGCALGKMFGVETATQVTATDWQAEVGSVPSERIVTDSTIPPPKHVFANENGNTVDPTTRVVTEAVGDPLGEMSYLQYYPAATNARTYSNDLTNAAWTKSNVTAAKNATGIDGAPNTGCTLTATAANGTVIGSAITAASGNHATCWHLKRKTGTGNIDLTVDGGATWQNVTLTSAYQKFTVDQASVTNPQIGIRIVTSGDAVEVGNAECYTAKTIAQVRGLGPIFTTSAAVSTDKTSYTITGAGVNERTQAFYYELVFDEGDDVQAAFFRATTGAGRIIQVDTRESTQEISINGQYENGSGGLIQGYFHQNLPFNTLMRVAVSMEEAGEAATCVNGFWGTASSPTYGFYRALSADLLHGQAQFSNKVRNLRQYDITTYAEGKALIDTLMEGT